MCMHVCMHECMHGCMYALMLAYLHTNIYEYVLHISCIHVYFACVHTLIWSNAFRVGTSAKHRFVFFRRCVRVSVILACTSQRHTYQLPFGNPAFPGGAGSLAGSSQGGGAMHATPHSSSTKKTTHSCVWWGAHVQRMGLQIDTAHQGSSNKPFNMAAVFLSSL